MELLNTPRSDLWSGKARMSDNKRTKGSGGLSQAPLTDREREVLACLADGMTNPQTALHLGITERTVLHHVAGARAKLGCKTRVEAVVKAVRLGMI